MPVERDPLVGTVLQDRYRVVERLSAGGMGVVYRGERIGLGRSVAIKFLHRSISGEPEFVRRFEVEARSASRLVHPNCVPVIDFGHDGGTPYLVMEYVEGKTLRDLLERGPLPPAQAVAIARQILAALAHAHGLHVIHRDVKPENVLVGETAGFGAHARLLDFGLAKLRDNVSGPSTSGFAVGTPSYMAPEQTLAQPVDARTDVYATGIVLFEMLTGRKPYQAPDAIDLLKMHREAPTPSVRDVVGSRVSLALDAAIRKAMAKDPAQRFADAAEFAAALDTTPEARGAGGETRRKGGKRYLLAIGVAGALIAGVAVLVVFASTDSERPGKPGASPPAADATAGAPDEELAIEPGATGAEEALAEAERLLAAGRTDAAVKLLERLRSRDPRSGPINHRLGHAYFTKLFWSDGLAAYKTAIAADDGYRRDPTLIRDLIRSLMSDKFHPQAAAFITREIGAEALPYLDEAAEKSAAVTTRQRAKALAARLRGE